MKVFFCIASLFFAFSLIGAESYSEKVYLDKNTGKGSFVTTVAKKDCDTNLHEDEKYKEKAQILCESKGFLLLDFDSSFLDGGCSVEYIFKCDISYPKKRAMEEKIKSDNVYKAKDKCGVLGFEKDSPKFRNCVMDLIK
jgi:hypothetical protein